MYIEFHSNQMDKKIVYRRKQVQKSCLQQQPFALTKCTFPLHKNNGPSLKSKQKCNLFG